MSQSPCILRALVVVEFDPSVGQVPRLIIPQGALSAVDAAKLAYLALPDSNASVQKDLVYCFRFRTDSLPLFATTALGHQYSFGCAFFRQQRDRTLARGFLQKSVVAVAQLPYVGLLKKIVRTVGPLFFSAESVSIDASVSLLTSAFREISHWPRLVPGTTTLLPLLGECLPCQVPWTGLENYRPSFVGTLRPHRGQNRGRSDSVTSSLSNAAFSSSFTSLSPTDVLDADFGVLSAVQESSIECSASDFEVPGNDGARNAASQALPPSSFPPEGAGSAAVLSLSEVFAAKNLELAGLFQEIGLFTVFRGLSSHLWLLWELVITGQPIMIFSATPDLCGDAVLALVSLISPLEFCADYRPYFTLFDPDFQQVAAMLDAHHPQSSGRARMAGVTRAPRHVRLLPKKGHVPAPPVASVPEPDLDPRLLRLQPQHPLIIGSTNPYFTKALQNWPNAVWLSTAANGLGVPTTATGLGGRARTASTGKLSRGAFSTPNKLDHRGSSASLFSLRSLRPAVDAKSTSVQSAAVSSPSDGACGIVDTSAVLDSGRARVASGVTPDVCVFESHNYHPSPSVARSSEKGSSGQRRASASVIAAPAAFSGVLKIVNASVPLSDVLPTASLHLTSRDTRTVIASATNHQGVGTTVPAKAPPISDEGCIVVRRAAFLHPDRSLLRQLYRAPLTSMPPADGGGATVGPSSPYGTCSSPVGHDGGGRGSVISSIDSGFGAEHPTVAINNVLLRQHFRSLTLAFVAPFELYFTLDPRLRYDSSGALAAGRGPMGGGKPIPGGITVGASSQGWSLLGQGPYPALMSPLTAGSYGPYDDYMAAMLPKFDEESFMVRLARDGGPKHRVLATAQWQPLYRGFISSPHFHPWFHARRREVNRQLFDLTRSLRFSTTVPEMLLSAVGPAAHHFLDAATWRQGIRTSTSLPTEVAEATRRCSDVSQKSGVVASYVATLPAPAVTTSAPSPATSPLDSPIPVRVLTPSFLADDATTKLDAKQDNAFVTLSKAAGFWPVVVNPGPLVRVVGRGTPHSATLFSGAAAPMLQTPPMSPLTLSRQTSAMAGNIVASAGSMSGNNTLGNAHGVDATLAPAILSPMPATPLAPPSGSSVAPFTDTSSSGDETEDREPWQFDARPSRRLTPADIAAFDCACIELHRKINACFVREAGLLADDMALSNVMSGHLDALEALMPERLLETLIRPKSTFTARTTAVASATLERDI